MKNIEDLREHLFATLAALRDEKNPMDLDRAKAVAGVAQVLVDSARVEVEMARVTGARVGSAFLPQLPAPQPVNQIGTPANPRLVKGSAQA